MSSFWKLERKEWLFCLLIALLYFSLATYATQSGPGASPDTAGYLRVTESLLAGRGFIQTPAEATLNGVAIPFTSQPPLFPLALTLFAWLWPGADAVDAAARWVPILHACLAFFPIYWIGRGLGGKWAAILAVLALFGFHNYIWLASYAWSDTTFILVVGINLALMTALALHLPTLKPLPLWFLLLGFTVALANLTRTVGFFVFAAGCTLLFFALLRLGIKRMILPTLLYGLTFVACIFPWYARNMRISGTLSGYPWVTDRVHLSMQESIATMLRALATDLPPRLHFGLRQNPTLLLALLLISFVMIGLALLLAVRFFRQANWFGRVIAWPGWPTLVYVTITIVGLTVIGGTVQIFPGEWSRYLGASYPYLWLLAAVALVWFWRGLLGLLPGQNVSIRRAATAVAVLALAALWTTTYLQNTLGFARNATNGQQFTAPDWVNSQGIAYIEQLPTDAIIYSDGLEVVWYLTRRHTNWIPLAPAGEAGVTKMLTQIQSHAQPTYVISFTGEHHGAFRATEADILAADQQNVLTVVAQLDDAVVMKVK